MKKKQTLYPRSVKDIKGKVALAELHRAHVIIVVLALSLAVSLALAGADALIVDPLLAALMALLLGIVAIFSLLTALALKK